MLLQKLIARNSRGSVLNLPLEDISNGFLVKDIEGLGPVKATLVSSNFATMDGEEYHTSRRDKRNIVIKLGLVPDYGSSSAHELRSQLYDFFMPKTEITLDFDMFDRHTSETDTFRILGRIESFEPVIFAKEPEVNLSIVCYESSFFELSSIVAEGDTLTFPASTPRITVSYDGTVETGALLELTLPSGVNEIRVFQSFPGIGTGTSFMQLGGNYLAGDVLKISSVPGNKFITITRGGVTESYLHDLVSHTGWLVLFPGDNLIAVSLDVAVSRTYTLEYTKRHGGL